MVSYRMLKDTKGVYPFVRRMSSSLTQLATWDKQNNGYSPWHCSFGSSLTRVEKKLIMIFIPTWSQSQTSGLWKRSWFARESSSCCSRPSCVCFTKTWACCVQRLTNFNALAEGGNKLIRRCINAVRCTSHTVQVGWFLRLVFGDVATSHHPRGPCKLDEFQRGGLL